MINNYREHSVLSDIKSIISNSFCEFNLTSKQLDSLAYFVYKHQINNIYTLDINYIIETTKVSEEVATSLAALYKERLFARIAFYTNSQVNDIPINNYNSFLAYDKVTRPTGCNSPTFESNDLEAIEVRENLSSIFGF